MNDLSKLLDKLNTDASKQNEEILAEATAKAKTITADYIKQCEDLEQTILAEAQAKTDGLSRRTQSQGDISLRNGSLAARRALINQAFERAISVICNSDQEQLIAYFVALACDAQTQDQAQILLNKADATRFGAQLVQCINERQQAHALTVILSDEHHTKCGGFILRQGDIDSNCTVEVLVSNQTPALEAQVSAILFA